MKDRERMEGRRKAVLTAAGILVTCVFLFPLYWMVATSLRPPGESFSNPSFFPSRIVFDSYILKNEHGISLFTYLKNSVVVSFGATALTLVLGVPASYGLARFKSRMISVLLFIFLVAQMLPSSLILTPLFVNFNKLGLINNHLGVILSDATITIPFVVIILRTYFKDIPKELEEAAIIDGCGPLGTFIRIMVPISYPGIVTATSMALFMSWGDMVFSLTFLNQEKLKTAADSLQGHGRAGSQMGDFNGILNRSGASHCYRVYLSAEIHSQRLDRRLSQRVRGVKRWRKALEKSCTVYPKRT